MRHPAKSQMITICLASVLFLLVYAVYLQTLNPTLAMGDGGELISAAYSLGLAHSPSFPLYTLLLKPFLRIPIGQIALRANLFSGLTAALTISLFFLLLSNWTPAGISLAGALVYAWISATWQQANHAEVYALAYALASLILFCTAQASPGKNRILLAFFLWGLLGANHSLIAAALSFVFLINLRHLRNTKRIIQATTLLLLALSLYTYLPIRSIANPPINWGHPKTAGLFSEAISRKSTVGTFFSSSSRLLLPRLAMLGGIFFRQFNLLLPLALAGLFLLPGTLSFGLFSIILLNLLSQFFHLYFSPYHPDILAYYGLSNLVLACGLTLSLNSLALFCQRQLTWRTLPKKVKYALRIFGVFFLGCLILLNNFDELNERWNQWAYHFGRDILTSLPRGEILGASEIDFAFPLAYLKIVEGRREDLVILESNIFPPALSSRELSLFLIQDRSLSLSFVESLAADYLPAQARLRPQGMVYHLQKQPKAFFMSPWRYLHYPRQRAKSHDYLTSWLRADYAIMAGEAAYLQGKSEQALAFWDEAAELAYYDKETHNLLGLNYSRRNYPALAFSAFQTALTIEPAYVNAYTNLGNWHLQHGDSKSAIEVFKQAIAIAPKDADTLNNLGYLYAQSDQTREQGMTMLRQCLKLNPDYLKAYYNLGRLYFDAGQLAEAQEYFYQLYQRQPQNVAALNSLGGIALKKGKLKEAEFYFKEVLKVSPDYPLTLYNLINLYEMNNDRLQAQPLLRRLLALEAQLPSNQVWLIDWARQKSGEKTP